MEDNWITTRRVQWKIVNIDDPLPSQWIISSVLEEIAAIYERFTTDNFTLSRVLVVSPFFLCSRNNWNKNDFTLGSETESTTRNYAGGSEQWENSRARGRENIQLKLITLWDCRHIYESDSFIIHFFHIQPSLRFTNESVRSKTSGFADTFHRNPGLISIWRGRARWNQVFLHYIIIQCDRRSASCGMKCLVRIQHTIQSERESSAEQIYKMKNCTDFKSPR